MKIYKTLRKRGLALFLALTMCLSLIQTTAFATEQTGHTHNEGGWICTQAEPTRELTCKHEHTADCYVPGEPVLNCEDSHHTEACYTPGEDVLNCEEDHEHSEECYVPGEPVLTCGGKAHHTEECYVPGEDVLNCTHEHTEECYTVTEGEWTCVPPEVEEVPEEVQKFLDVAALIPEDINVYNAEEAGELVNAAFDAWEALVDAGLDEYEGVAEALAKVEAAYVAVEEALELGSSNYAGRNGTVYEGSSILEFGTAVCYDPADTGEFPKTDGTQISVIPWNFHNEKHAKDYYYHYDYRIGGPRTSPAPDPVQSSYFEKTYNWTNLNYYDPIEINKSVPAGGEGRFGWRQGLPNYNDPWGGLMPTIASVYLYRLEEVEGVEYIDGGLSGIEFHASTEPQLESSGGPAYQPTGPYIRCDVPIKADAPDGAQIQVRYRLAMGYDMEWVSAENTYNWYVQDFILNFTVGGGGSTDDPTVDATHHVYMPAGTSTSIELYKPYYGYSYGQFYRDGAYSIKSKEITQNGDEGVATAGNLTIGSATGGGNVLRVPISSSENAEPDIDTTEIYVKYQYGSARVDRTEKIVVHIIGSREMPIEADETVTVPVYGNSSIGTFSRISAPRSNSVATVKNITNSGYKATGRANASGSDTSTYAYLYTKETTYYAANGDMEGDVALTLYVDVTNFTVPDNDDPSTIDGLDIKKEATPSSVVDGDELTYILTVTNTSSVAKTVTVTDSLPNGVDFNRFDPADSQATYDESNWTVTWTPTVQAGGTATLRIVCDVNVSRPGSINNRAVLTSGNGATKEDTVQTPATTKPTPSLSITKSVDKKTVNKGDTLTYTITVTNSGTADAKDVTVADPLNAEWLKWQGAKLNGEAIATQPANGVYTIGTVAKKNGGVDGTATLTITAEAIKAGTLPKNTAYLNPSDPANPGGGNGGTDDSDPVEVKQWKLSVVKTITHVNGKDYVAGKTKVKPGDTVTYKVEITNTGDNIYYDARVSDRMDASLTMTGPSQVKPANEQQASRWSYLGWSEGTRTEGEGETAKSIKTHNYYWKLSGAFEPKEVITLTYSATVATDGGKVTLKNLASVRGYHTAATPVQTQSIMLLSAADLDPDDKYYPDDDDDGRDYDDANSGGEVPTNPGTPGGDGDSSGTEIEAGEAAQVTYVWSGLPEGANAPQLPTDDAWYFVDDPDDPVTLKGESTYSNITAGEGASAETYVFKGWTLPDGVVKNADGTVTMPEGGLTVTGVWEKKEQASVTVNYVTDGGATLGSITYSLEKDQTYDHSKDGSVTAIPTTGSANAKSPVKVVVDGHTYIFDEVETKDSLTGTISTSPVTINVVYTLDDKGTIGTDDEGSPTDTTDGTPDKYQAKVIYTATDGGTQTGVTTYATITDETGNMATEGTISIDGATASADEDNHFTKWTAEATNHDGWNYTESTNATLAADDNVAAKGGAEYTFTAYFEANSGAPLSVSADDVTTTYDGRPHPVTPTANKAGAAFTVVYKDAAGNVITGAPVDAGEYTAEITATLDGKNATYTAKVTINKRQLNVTTGSDSKVYDGTPLTNATATVTVSGGEVSGEHITATATGSQTEVGESKNTYTMDWGSAKEGNYQVTEFLGTLRVTAQSTIIPPTDPYYPPYNPGTPSTTIPDAATPLDPGTDIDDQDVPLAGTVGLNNTDHFAYVIGYDEDHVRPLANITRAEAATIFFRLMEDDFRQANWATTNSFTDVKEGDWYNNAVSTCARAGILKGREDGRFDPNATITRAEFAVMAARFLDGSQTDDGTGDFSDTASHWAAKEIRLAAKAGWITGSGNKFEPDAYITRAQVMLIVNRMLDRTPDADHMLPEMKKWSDNPEGTWYYEAVQEATNEHDYTRDETNVETWTALKEGTDWAALELGWAANNGASASGTETETQGLPDGI